MRCRDRERAPHGRGAWSFGKTGGGGGRRARRGEGRRRAGACRVGRGRRNQESRGGKQVPSVRGRREDRAVHPHGQEAGPGLHRHPQLHEQQEGAAARRRRTRIHVGLRRYVPGGRPCRRRFRVLRTHRHADVQEQGGRGPAHQWPALQGDDGHAPSKTRILGTQRCQGPLLHTRPSGRVSESLKAITYAERQRLVAVQPSRTDKGRDTRRRPGVSSALSRRRP